MFNAITALHIAFEVIDGDVPNPQKTIVLIPNRLVYSLCELARAVGNEEEHLVRAVVMHFVARDDETGKLEPSFIQRLTDFFNVQKSGTSINDDQVRPVGHSQRRGFAGSVGYNDFITPLHQVWFHRMGIFGSTFNKQHPQRHGALPPP
jgi:hypothetical protein